MSSDRQPDRFDDGPSPVAVTASAEIRPRIAASDLDDAALIAAIPGASLRD